MSIVNTFSLEGKNAYITGAAQGIGEATAHAFASAGANVAIVDLKQEAEQTAHTLQKQYNVKSFPIIVDITKPDGIEKMKNALVKEFGTLDIAFNNAGIVNNIPTLELSYEDWFKVIDVNLTGVFLTCQLAGRLMIPNKKGSIINTASMSAHIVNIPQPQCPYNASKAGVIQLTRSLAVEWAPHNVRVNSISPGYIATTLIHNVPQENRDAWIEQSVTKRLGRPEDLVGILVYLAGDHAQFTTGADFIIDGGFTCV